MNTTKQHFLSLNGNWIFQRKINGLQTMTGQASFSILSEAPNCYWYFEEGSHLNLSQTFYREYIYCLEKPGIKVYLAREKKNWDSCMHFNTFQIIML